MTAKGTVKNWLEAWKDKDAEGMLAKSQRTWLQTEGLPKRWTENYIYSQTLKNYKLLSQKKLKNQFMEFDNFYVFRVKVIVIYDPETDNPKKSEEIRKINVVREDKAFNMAESGDWGVNPLSSLRRV